MKLLFIKQSSLGDIFHCFPALTEAMRALPNLSVDWVIEEGFSEMPSWHPVVDRVIPIAHRRWRKQPFSSTVRKEKKAFVKTLQSRRYDRVIDAQNLFKSAWLVRLVKAPSYGLNWASIRTERPSSWFYDVKLDVPQGQHAIHRLRQLLSKALGYQYQADNSLDYQLSLPYYDLSQIGVDPDYVVGLHGTTWESKHWPVDYWKALARLITSQGLQLILPWGTAAEKVRAELIANVSDQVKVLPALGLTDLSCILQKAKAIVAVDTGLAHIAAALDVPMINLFAPTNAVLTAALGEKVVTLVSDYQCAPCMRQHCQFKSQRMSPPCYQSLSAERIWSELQTLLE